MLLWLRPNEVEHHHVFVRTLEKRTDWGGGGVCSIHSVPLLLTSSPFLTWNAFCCRTLVPSAAKEKLGIWGIPTRTCADILESLLHNPITTFNPFFVCIGFVTAFNWMKTRKVFGDNPITKMKSRIFAFQGSKRRMLLTIPIDSQNSLCEKSTQKWSQSSGSSRQVATKFMRVPVLAACVDGHIFGPLPRQKKAASRERVHTANVVLFREVVFLEQRIYNGEKIPLLLLLVFVLSQKQWRATRRRIFYRSLVQKCIENNISCLLLLLVKLWVVFLVLYINFIECARIEKLVDETKRHVCISAPIRTD